MNSPQILVATRNPGKLTELLRIFAPVIPSVELLTLADFPDAPDVEETGDTFEANALLKARAAFEISGLPSLADDSGLVVDALGGAPGVKSARYSGEGTQGNIAKVLAELSGIDLEKRSARFVSVVALVTDEGEPLLARGELEGVILFEPKGERGFGYDPIFKPLESERTLAEMDPEEKDAISHRGRALREMAPLLGLRLRPY